ncbi:FecR family protein [Chryseobacterium sp. MEBOG07]|uniref:FecR family protein n=1 Tax=Chryseobacterium sp. MEBOG07 TaxID=2879939 RepID=UPI001F37E2D7|nr:FecR family protein [Chryseobacterium sp. MEBOG07]UKB78577.1 FecR domain-containing protein [Chryseobacterium sp. MEBOG07]
MQQLLEKYRDHRCSPQEVKHLLGYFHKDSREQDQLMELVLNHLKEIPAPAELDDSHFNNRLDEAYLNIRKELEASHTQSKATWQLWKKILTAATITLTVGIGSLYYIHRYKIYRDHTLQAKDIRPGGHKARLTLSDGHAIELSSGQSGIIIGDKGVFYNNGAAISNKKVSGLLTISTPKGGEYEVVLPDGSKVWLNAATTLQYSASLRDGARRKVMLVDGEAYFEVAKDKKHPFVVSSRTQVVEVLGTHFNINSYHDQERTVTTLEEGSVKVSPRDSKASRFPSEIILKPGQQSLSFGGKLTLHKADLQSALAWKEGLIYFRDAPIQEVLRQISRWYNIEIEYEGVPTKEVFNGGVKRSADLSAVLHILELSNIHFSLKEKNTKTILTILQ